MSKYQVLYYPDSKLREIAKPVEKIDTNIKKIIQDMFDIMYQDEGGGLAAPQLGIPLKLVTVDDSERPPLVLINPEIVTLSDNFVKNVEGCLSLPGISAEVARPNYVKVKAQDIHGKLFEIEAKDDYMARCLQHEIDHLHGTLYIDYVSALKRERLIKEMRKFLKRRS